MPEITVLIKTFERPDACRQLFQSIRKKYPTIPIIIVDDSKRPGDCLRGLCLSENTHVEFAPFDIGLAAGRNLGITLVKTPYVFICDDDCTFTEDTDLEKALALLKASDLSILAIEASGVKYSGTFYTVETDIGKIVHMRSGFHSLRSTPEGEVRIFDFVPNIFIAKTVTFQAYPWDHSLKVGEHFAYFYGYLGYLKVGATDAVKIGHGFKSNSTSYQSYRRRAIDYVKEYMRNNAIWKRIDLNGQTVEV